MRKICSTSLAKGGPQPGMTFPSEGSQLLFSSPKTDLSRQKMNEDFFSPTQSQTWKWKSGQMDFPAIFPLSLLWGANLSETDLIGASQEGKNEGGNRKALTWFLPCLKKKVGGKGRLTFRQLKWIFVFRVKSWAKERIKGAVGRVGGCTSTIIWAKWKMSISINVNLSTKTGACGNLGNFYPECEIWEQQYCWNGIHHV